MMKNQQTYSSQEKPAAKLPIAVGIVLEDENDLLESTLQSARQLSDLVFVVSPEGVRLPDITKEFAVTAIQSSFCDDEAKLRNLLIENVEAEEKIDWILWLNPGERFDDATREEFARFLESGIERNSLYVMVLHRLMRPDGRRHDLDEETIDVRLMPLRKGVRFQGRIKATALPVAMKLMIGLSASPGRILCPPKRLNPGLDKIRGERALRILREMEDQGEIIKEEKLALRAEAYAAIGEFSSARHGFLRLIEETSDANLRLTAYYDLWETFTYSPIDVNEMTKVLLAGLDHFPVDMQLLTFMGAHLQRTGKLDIAARTFETAVRYGQISLDVWHRLHIREIAVTSLALVQRLRGRTGEAIRILETNLEAIDDRSEYGRHLLDIYIAEQMEAKAHQFAATIWGAEDLDRIRAAISGACQATGGEWKNALESLKKAFSDGCRDVLCLRWYSLTLLSLVRFDEALNILKQWIAAEPDNSEARSYFFAAQHPESFSEIIRTIQNVQLHSLGIAGAELFKKESPSETKRKDRSAIDQAVREMVSASGTPGSKIRCFKPSGEK